MEKLQFNLDMEKLQFNLDPSKPPAPPIRGISLPPVAVPSGLLTRPLSHSDRGLRKKDFCEILNISSTNPLALSIIIRRTDVTVVCEDFLRLRATP